MRRNYSKTIRTVLLYLAVALVVIATIGPVLWMFITSISDGREMLSLPPRWIPREPTLHRYEAIFFSGEVRLWGATATSPGATFLRGIVNSLVVATTTTLICLVFGMLAAYAIVRLRFAGKRLLMISLIAVQMLPAIALVIPLFFIIRSLGLIDSTLSLILTYSGFIMTYAIWVLSSYLRSIPLELEEAAFLDGCSHIQALRYVTLPLTVPGLVGVGIFCFLISWNEFLYALIFTHTASAKTLPVVISEFSTQFGLDYGMVMTGGVIASLPPMLIALLFQRYIVRGLAAGAVKG